MINTYYAKVQGNLSLSPHFTVREFQDNQIDIIKIDTNLIEALERLYARLQCSKIIITSGYRANDGGSFHTKGMAADVNCYVNGIRLQGQPILLAAQDVGIRGIGWVPGSAVSRAAVHLDTRPTRYYFDEANYNRSIGNSWYTFFGVSDPLKPPPAPANPYDEPTALVAMGQRGESVRWVQWQLSFKGFPCGLVDGIFGLQTLTAVRNAQRAGALVVDGLVGPATRAFLKK